MTTRATHLLLCSVALSAILILAGCRRPDDTPPVTPTATSRPAQVAPTSAPVAAVEPTAPPTPAPVLLLGAGSDGRIIAAWPAGHTKQFVAPGSLLYGQPLSPDGRQMVIETQRANRDPRQIAMLNLADGRIEPLHLLSEPNTVHWSPDGRYLLYGYRQASGDQLVLHDFASGDNTPIAAMWSIFLIAGWSADGSEIAFVASDDWQYDLYVLDVATRAVRRLTNNLAVETAVVWSPVDRMLLVGTTRYDERVLWEGSPYGVTTLYLIGSDGQSQTLGYYDLITSPSLALSPDGQQIAFSEKGALCILDRATRQTTCPLAETTPFGDYFAAFGESPVWSPDARWLAFRAAGHDNGSNCGGVYALALATGAVSIVEEGSCQTGPLSWVDDWPAAEPAPMATAEPSPTQLPTPTPTPPPNPTPTPTPPPGPIPTPVSARGWTRETPFTIDEVAYSWAWQVRVQEVVRGDDAWAMLQAASPLNEPPPAGMQYILVRLRAASTLPRQQAINHNDFALTGDHLILYHHAPVIVPEPELDADLVRGEWREGWLAFLTGQDEGQLILVIDELLEIDAKFIALDEGASITFDYSAPWSMSPTDAGTTRADPAPPGTTVRTYDWEVTVTEVLRGEAAWAAVQGASPANAPPPEGMEYVAIKLSVWRHGFIDLPRRLDGHDFILIGGDNIFHPWPAVAPPEPALDVQVYPGGRYEGWIVRMARAGEEQLMLRFTPPFGGTDDTIRYLALAEGVSAVVPPEFTAVEPDRLRHSRLHPAPFGQTLVTEDWELTVLEVIRGGEALALVPQDNPFNETPAPGMEFLAVKLRARYIATVDEPPGHIFDLDFGVIGESNVIYDPPVVDEPAPAQDVYLYPGGEYEGWMILQTREGSTELVLVFLPYSSPRAYYMSLVP